MGIVDSVGKIAATSEDEALKFARLMLLHMPQHVGIELWSGGRLLCSETRALLTTDGL